MSLKSPSSVRFDDSGGIWPVYVVGVMRAEKYFELVIITPIIRTPDVVVSLTLHSPRLFRPPNILVGGLRYITATLSSIFFFSPATLAAR